MKDVMSCPVCKKEVFSGLGEGCRMCGMAIDGGVRAGVPFEEGKDFCCKICMRKFNSINRVRGC